MKFLDKEQFDLLIDKCKRGEVFFHEPYILMENDVGIYCVTEFSFYLNKLHCFWWGKDTAYCVEYEQKNLPTFDKAICDYADFDVLERLRGRSDFVDFLKEYLVIAREVEDKELFPKMYFHSDFCSLEFEGVMPDDEEYVVNYTVYTAGVRLSKGTLSMAEFLSPQTFFQFLLGQIKTCRIYRPEVKEHPEFLDTFMEACGFETLEQLKEGNGIGILEEFKKGIHELQENASILPVSLVKNFMDYLSLKEFEINELQVYIRNL